MIVKALILFILQIELKQKDDELQKIITDVEQAVVEERQKLYAEHTQKWEEDVQKTYMEFYEELQRKDSEIKQKDEQIRLLRAVVENESQQRSRVTNLLQECMQIHQQLHNKYEQFEKEHQIEQQKLYMELQRTHSGEAQ